MARYVSVVCGSPRRFRILQFWILFVCCFIGIPTPCSLWAHFECRERQQPTERIYSRTIYVWMSVGHTITIFTLTELGQTVDAITDDFWFLDHQNRRTATNKFVSRWLHVVTIPPAFQVNDLGWCTNRRSKNPISDSIERQLTPATGSSFASSHHLSLIWWRMQHTEIKTTHSNDK